MKQYIIMTILLLSIPYMGYTVDNENIRYDEFIQQQLNKGVSALQPQDFQVVYLPKNFSILMNLTWGAKILFNHPDFKEVIPVHTYNLNDICANQQILESYVLESNVGKLTLTGLVFRVESSNRKHSILAWSDSLMSLKEVCDKGWANEAENQFDMNTIKNIPEYLDDLVKNSHKQDTNDFIVLIDSLPDIKEINESWWMCKDDSILVQNALCHEVYKYSPFYSHKQLAREAGKNPKR